MEEFINNSTLNQLLILTLFPIGAAILLVAFLFFYYRRDRNKTKMKLGTQVSEKDAAAQSPKHAEPEDDVSLLPDESETVPGMDDQITPGENDLNLDILGRKIDTEGPDMPSSSQSGKEKIDIDARLRGADSAPPESRTAAASAQSAETTTVSGPVSSNEPSELLRFLKHPQTGRLVIEVAGQQYHKLTDIDDREVGQYILELAAHLLAFTNGVVATDVGVKSVYLPKVGPTPAPLVKFTPITQLPDPDDVAPPETETEEAPSEPLVPPPPPEAEAAFLASLQAQPPRPEPAPPQRRGIFGRPAKPAEEPVLMPQFNLADEINKIVQARLVSSPLTNVAKIEILSDLSGGIRINVDGHIYSSPDDVPDPEAKELIKAAIKQWERS